MSSDAGLLLIKEFAVKIGLVRLIYSLFQTNDTATFRLHTKTILALAEDKANNLRRTTRGNSSQDLLK